MTYMVDFVNRFSKWSFSAVSKQFPMKFKYVSDPWLYFRFLYSKVVYFCYNGSIFNDYLVSISQNLKNPPKKNSRIFLGKNQDINIDLKFHHGSNGTILSLWKSLWLHVLRKVQFMSNISFNVTMAVATADSLHHHAVVSTKYHWRPRMAISRLNLKYHRQLRPALIRGWIDLRVGRCHCHLTHLKFLKHVFI